MRWGVIVFPGSCDDQDVHDALKRDLGQKVKFLWHKDDLTGAFDCLVLPGGFSYGDYLRCGAVARFSPIMRGVHHQYVGARRLSATKHMSPFQQPASEKTRRKI